MTIPEAVQLVIRAGDLGAGTGEVFVLEMGEPVKILDLAHNMIRLALGEGVDIAVEVIGPRPGEAPRGALPTPTAPAPTASEKIVRAVRRMPLDPVWVRSRGGWSSWSARATRRLSSRPSSGLGAVSALRIPSDFDLPLRDPAPFNIPRRPWIYSGKQAHAGLPAFLGPGRADPPVFRAGGDSAPPA